jgi:archaellum component FlaG (FlaF/FlaG flagellin family)
MVDGQLIDYTNVTMGIVGHSSMWNPSRVLQLTVSGVALGPGDHYVKVSVHTGASDDLGFRL